MILLCLTDRISVLKNCRGWATLGDSLHNEKLENVRNGIEEVH